MSTLPQFIKDQKDNVVWRYIANQKKSWLESRIRALLKKESLAIRYTYGYLRYIDKDNRGFAYPAQATIARAVKVSPRHVIRCLARLEALDLIIRGKRGGHSYYIFTLPSSLKETKSPLEVNLEAITQEVRELKEKALKPHLDMEKNTQRVTFPCHTNKIKIKNKIKTSPPIKPEKKALQKPLAPLPSQPKEQDWYSWIEEKKDISLTKKEKESLLAKEKKILTSRQNRLPHLPLTFLKAGIRERALTWILQTHRNIIYTGKKTDDLWEIGL